MTRPILFVAVMGTAVSGALVAVAPAAVANTRAAQATVAAAPRAAVLQESRVIGYSVQGRAITARRYGSATATKVGVIIGSMHGSELAGVKVAKRLETVGAPGSTAMWVIRNVNPDGAKRGRRQNAHGVDLNRNSPHIWKGTARAPWYYPGPSAASEPETQAFLKFLTEVDPDVVMIYHQHGNGVDSYRQKNKGLTKGLATRMGLRVRSFNCDGECTGTLTGWFNNNRPGTAITIELPAKVTTKRVKRWAKAARWAVTYVPDVALPVLY